jgi:ectoine hydroxylase-related dioxygenase (phytanoyl-CoA dioxygenase family)
VYDLCAHPAVTEAVADVLGPDVVLWNSVLMNKTSGAPAVPWHQDRDFEFLAPDRGLAAWLALDDADRTNGCLQMIPGSHKSVLPARLRTRPDEFDSEVEAAHTADRPRFPVELQAGEFVLFHNKILHYSAPNHSAERRLGLAMRYTTPSVRVDTAKLFDGSLVYPVRGVDRRGVNPTGVPPADTPPSASTKPV